MDPINHDRREKRMLNRANKRWDNAYTVFSDDLTEEEQRYRDYFETDLQNYREDERVEEVLFPWLSFWISKNYWQTTNTIWINSISNRTIQVILRMIKLLILRRRYLNSNIDELWILSRIMSVVMVEWCNSRRRDLLIINHWR